MCIVTILYASSEYASVFYQLREVGRLRRAAKQKCADPPQYSSRDRKFVKSQIRARDRNQSECRRD